MLRLVRTVSRTVKLSILIAFSNKRYIFQLFYLPANLNLLFSMDEKEQLFNLLNEFNIFRISLIL